MNFQGLAKAKKDEAKGLIKELRKLLYGTNATANEAILKEGLVVNFGKGTEKRQVITIKAM